MTTTQDSGTKAATETGTESRGSAEAGQRGRLAAVGEGAAEAYRTARERTAAAYEGARGSAGSVARRAADGIEANPVAAVVGGLALGALAAALLPKSQREERLLGDVGRRLNDTAREAARAAREAGLEQIDELGLSREGVRRKLDDFTDRAVGAVKGSVKGRARE
jgi:hypothetical protein